MRILACLLAMAIPAQAADYVFTRPDLPSGQQMIFRRSDGALIYPSPADPNAAAFASFLAGGGVPDQPIDPARGVMVISSGTPALSGAYTFTPQNKADLFEISIYALSNNKFPGGFTQMPWRDAYGGVHTFSLAQWKAFVSALIDYDTASRTGQNPAEPITIP
jgi:hypothetical protein